MFKKILCGVCFLGLCALAGCDESGGNTQEPGGNGNTENTGNDNDKCQCADSSCENCMKETAVCVDDSKIKITSKIDGYDGSMHVTSSSTSEQSCPVSCVEDNEKGAHCSDGSGQGNNTDKCMCNSEEDCDNCSTVIKTTCVNGMSIGRLDAVTVTNGYTPSGTQINLTQTVGTDCPAKCVQDSETEAHCL